MSIVMDEARSLTVRTESLDPIYVTLQDYELGRGRITIACYEHAWTTAWGAMSGRTVAQFFVACDEHYLVSNLLSGLPRRGRKLQDSDEAYLARIVRAVQQALSSVAAQETRGVFRPYIGTPEGELWLELALRRGPAYQCGHASCLAYHNAPDRFDRCPTCERKGYLSGSFVKENTSQQYHDWVARHVAKHRKPAFEVSA